MSQGQTDPATEVQRYGIRALYADEIGPSDNGAFVRFSDYQALALRERRMREALDKAESLVAPWTTCCDYRAEPELQKACRIMRSALAMQEGSHV